MGDPHLPPKGSVPKGQWFNNTEPLVIRKNFKYTQPLQPDEMSHQKYNPQQILFVKNIPQYSASHIAGLFTQYKPLEVKNLYPQSDITTFMVALPNADVARMALDVTDGLRVDSTIVAVEPYNAKQSTVPGREARKKHNGSFYSYTGDGWDGYEAGQEVQDDQLATKERVTSNVFEKLALAPTRKVGEGISWANVVQGKVHEQPSPSPAMPTVTALPSTIDVPILTQLQQSKPTEQELFAAFYKEASVDRSSRLPPPIPVSRSNQYSPPEHDIGAKARFPPPLRGTFTSPPSAPARPAPAQGLPVPTHRLPMSTPYPNGPPGFASERTRFPPPGLAPSLRSPFVSPPIESGRSVSTSGPSTPALEPSAPTMAPPALTRESAYLSQITVTPATASPHPRILLVPPPGLPSRPGFVHASPERPEWARAQDHSSESMRVHRTPARLHRGQILLSINEARWLCT